MPLDILYLDTHNHPTCLEKFNGAKRYAASRGWHLVRRILRGPVEEGPAFIRHLKPDGCIVNTTRIRRPPRTFFKLDVPLVFLDCDRTNYPPTAVRVEHDSYGTGRLAADELLRLGLSRFYYIPQPFKPLWSVNRERGFRDRIEAAGHVVSQLPFKLTDLPSRGSIGVFAANDDRARNFKSRLRRTGLRIPQDIALISADDTPFAHQNALSSIRIDFERGGYYAAEMLDALLNPGRVRRTHAVFGDLCVMRRESTRHFAHSLSGIPAAMALIRSRACEGLSVAEVLACIGGSRRTAEITFRASTGHSIHEEITSLRLERIFSLLEDTSRPLGSFPDFCGFRTPQALRKAFRKRTGLSMLEWRNRLKLIPGKS